jgi:ankyrin repeat protein
MEEEFLHYVYDDELEELETFLEDKSEREIRNLPLNEALFVAVGNDSSQMVEILLDNGANANAVRDDEVDDEVVRVILFFALDNTNNSIIVESLLKHGANVRIVDAEGRGPLFHTNYYHIFKLLLDYGADIHGSDDLILFYAPDYNILKLLLEHGANVHARDDQILWSVIVGSENREDDPDIYNKVKILLEYGADLHKRNDRIIKIVAENMSLSPTKSKLNKWKNTLRLLFLYGANPNDLVIDGYVKSYRPNIIKSIFDTYMSTVKLNSKEAWEALVLWSRYLGPEYSKLQESFRNHKNIIWG